MSIVNKIESISNHLENAYNSLENIGIDLTNVNKNIENLSTQIESVYNDLPKVTDEDTEITLSPTKKGKMELVLKGNTEQTQYTGKNLWGGFTSYTSLNNGVAFTQNENGSVYANGTASSTSSITIANLKANNIYKKLQAGTYTMSKDSNLVQLQAYNVDTITLIASALTTETSKTFTISEEQNIAIRISVPQNKTIDNTINIQLEQGTATSYEPYVGGIPSPNPNYPQDIQIVTGNNEIVIESKNKVNVNINSQTINGISFTVNSDKTITANGTASSKATLYIGDSNFLTKPGTYTISSNLNSTGGVRFGVYLSGEYYNTNSSRTVTFNTSISSGRPYFQIDKDVTVSNLVLKPMIEEGSIATEYEPYKEKQNYPINLEELKLYKTGDYQDYFFETSGKNLFNNTFNHLGMYYTDPGQIGTFAEGDQWLGAYCPVEAGEIYSISKNILTSRFAIGVTKEIPNANTECLAIIRDDSVLKFENIAIPQEYSYLILYLSNTNESAEGLNIQIEKNNISTNYEPYGQGEWYLHTFSNNITLTGNEEMNVRASGMFGITTPFESKSTGAGDWMPIYCNRVKMTTRDNVYNNHIGISYGSSNNYYKNVVLRVDNNVTSINDFKTWLQTHETQIVYLLKEPLDIKITNNNLINQLNAIKKAISYNNQTNIYQVNNNLPFIISASALKKND